MLLLPKFDTAPPESINTSLVFSTLPNNLTELLNCLCSGPTSVKSLGILFILSFIKTVCEVLPSSKD